MLATTFARSIRQCRPIGMRAWALSQQTGIRAMSTHCIDFQKVRANSPFWPHIPTARQAKRILFLRPLAFHLFFTQRSEHIPTLSHPEEYKPDNLFEDEFEYGIAGEPCHMAEEFEFTAAVRNILTKVPDKVEATVL